MSISSSVELSVIVNVSVSSRISSSVTETLRQSSRPLSPAVNVRLVDKSLKSSAVTKTKVVVVRIG